jgi:4-aminobutyrate--pyruvate transaminase
MVADKETRRSFDPKLGIAAKLVAFGHQHGVVLRPIGDTVGFSPPLIIEEAQVDELVKRFGMALDDTAKWLAAQ